MLKGTTVTSATNCDLPRNHLWSDVRSEHCGMAMIGHLQLVWQPGWWKAFIVRVSFGFLTCLTLLLMTTMFLGWSRRLLAKYILIWRSARGSGRVASHQLILCHQTVHILCHIIQVSVPGWCCICVSELWLFMYSPVDVFCLFWAPYFFLGGGCKFCTKKLNPVIWIWSFADCTRNLTPVPQGSRKFSY
jgi:hypothetical protein